MRTISATEARTHLGELMRRVVEHGETVIVEHRGKPAMAVVSVAEYERLRSKQPAAAAAANDEAERQRLPTGAPPGRTPRRRSR
jgi:prevent-host-death family protein